MAPRAPSVVAPLLAALFAASSVQAASDRSDLFGRGYVSRAVLKNGERHPLFERTKIRVDFDHGTEQDGVSWKADCNTFVAPVEITQERLVIGQVVQTDMGCPGPYGRRDRWMSRFFHSDPRWRIRRDDRLKLTAGDRVIKLRRRAPRG